MRITWRTISGILYFFYFFFWSPIYPVCVSLLFPGIKLLWSLNLDMLQITEVTNLNLLVTILIRIQNHPSDNFVLPFNKSQETKTLDPTPETKEEEEEERDRKGEGKNKNQRNEKGFLSDPEHFFSRLELRSLLSLQLTIVESITSVEAPMRHLCVRFWHVLHNMFLTCLRAKKLAPCTHPSHFWHRNAWSAWQYNVALEPHSSQQTNLEVALGETASLLQELPWLLLSWLPLHISGSSLSMEWRERRIERGASI